MAYQPYLIAPFGTGLDTDQALWMLPVDAFQNIENGHIRHGYVEKRQGLRFLGDMVHGRPITAATNANPAVFTVASATGLSDGDSVSLHYLAGGSWANLNGQKYTIDNLAGTDFELLDSGGTAVDGTALGAYTANSGRLGSIEDLITSALITSATTATPAVFTSAIGASNGDKISLKNLAGGTWSTLNDKAYTAANVSGSTFQLIDSFGAVVDGSGLGAYTPSSGTAELIGNLRIMGIFRYIGSDNTRQLLISDTERVAIYNSTTNLFEPLDLFDLTSTLQTDDDVWASTNLDYIWAANWQNPGVNNRVYITNGKAYASGNPGTDGIVYYDATDRGAPATANVVQFQPSLGGSNLLYGCKHIFSIKQRLLTLHTFEFNGANTLTFPQRARWCAAQNPGNWDDTTPGGGGFVDCPTGEQIVSARAIQDVIIVNFTDSVWTLRPVPDPALPFRWDKINDFRACDGKMATVGYDRYIVAVGQRGITATDGVETRRVDERIQDFSDDEINNDQFGKVFGARSYSNRRTWILYPNIENDEANGALIYDDDSGAYSKYTFLNSDYMNVLGYGGAAIDYAAQDFIAANGLDLAADDFHDETALSFFWSKNAEIFLGGDRSGTIYIMETTGSDNGESIIFKLESAGWNPYKEAGVEAQLGYVDFYCDSDQATKLYVEFYKNDNETPYITQGMDLLPDLSYISSINQIDLTDAGDPTQGLTVYSGNHGMSTGKEVYFYGVEGMEEANDLQYEITVIDGNTFTVDVDATGFGTYTGGGQIVENRFYRTKMWKRVFGGGVGYVHQIKVFSEGANRPLKIHAFKPWFRKRGRRTLG